MSLLICVRFSIFLLETLKFEWQCSQYLKLNPVSIVVLVNRQGIYLTVCANNWSDKFNYTVCNDYQAFIKLLDVSSASL